MKKEKFCCFIQNNYSFLEENQAEKERSENIKKKIKEQIDYLIEKENISEFFTGMEEGADLFYADYILSKKKEKDIKLHCVIPFEEQAVLYSEKERDLYFDVAQRADSEIMISRKRISGSREKRDSYMVEKSSVIILLCDIKSSPEILNFQKIEKNKQIIVIDPVNSNLNASFKCIV